MSPPVHRASAVRPIAALAAVAVLLGGCSDTTSGATEQTCLSSAGCAAEPGYEGTLCLESICAPCASDAECVADAAYGSATRCSDAGRCEACDGQLDCPCADGDACDAGVCLAGTCVDCEAGAIDCVCGEGDACDTGARCVGGVCEACPAGALGCACGAEDACDDALVCMSEVCAEQECTEGAVGCPCTDDDTCDAGAGCHADGTCRTCDADAVGCACDPDGDGCTNDLLCDGEADAEACREAIVCADAGCGEHQLCDEGDAGVDAACLESCDVGWMWDAGSSSCVASPTANCVEGDPDSILADCAAGHRLCVEGSGGAGATCGDCEVGYTEDEQTPPQCRAVVTCEAIAAGCAAARRACDEATDHGDAACGACLSPYVADDSDGSCVPGPDSTCDDGADSIAADCAAADRLCVEGPPAACGDCVAGYDVNPASGLCEQLRSCVDLGCAALGRACDATSQFAVCGECEGGLVATDPDDSSSACRGALTCDDLSCGDTFCVPNDFGGDATCETSTCGADEALDVSLDTPACRSCGSASTACAGAGYTGRWWYETRTNGTCVCETADGYYFDSSLALLTQPCDLDGDGWVRSSARIFLQSGDPAIRHNARCDLKTIDRVTLQNEYEQRYAVLLCSSGGLVAAADGDCVTTALPLYEDAEIDADVTMAEDTIGYPAYARSGVGRRVRADEANPVTKYCVTERADYNANDLDDLTETAGMDVPSGLSLSDVETTMLDFAVFGELHRVYWEPLAGADAGTLVIAERSRCAEAGGAEVPFYLGYDEANGSTYWRECARNRRASYDADDPQPGHDLARWSCTNATAGTCDTPAPLVTPTGSLVIPAHGLCDVALPPADGIWRGMSHHSQFRCALVTADGAADEPWEVASGDLVGASAAGSGEWQLNACTVACPDGDAACDADCGSGDCATTSEALGGAGDPRMPVLSCAQSTSEAGTVGFLARRYTDDVDGADVFGYSEGCIDEWEHWPAFCPGYQADPVGGVQGTFGDGQLTAFGELACGCSTDFGGLECDFGCGALGGALLANDYTLAPRHGLWMCAEPALTGMQPDAIDDVEGPALFGTDDAGSTWRIEGGVDVSPRARARHCDGDCATGWSLR